MASELKVFSNDGTSTTDWWFMYKLPGKLAPKAGADSKFKKTTGLEYMYFHPKEINEDTNRMKTNKEIYWSDKSLDDKTNCLNSTLEQLYAATAESKKSLGWICYNDEKADGSSDSSSFGHSKGVLAFDLESDTAFWLLHSWPKFPNISTPGMASLLYGQTYICIQLENVNAARTIATQLYNQNEPQTYQVQLPPSIKSNDILFKVANAVDVNETDPPSDTIFISKGKNHFRMMAKNRHWNDDFWIDLVGPHLKTNLEVETWRRGTLPGTEDSNNENSVMDVLYIDLESLGVPYEWHYTKDHAKWGTSDTKFWVCIADINRQTSQEKRGGGTICFQNRELWEHLSGIEKLKQ